MMLPMWTKGDVRRLMRRIVRADRINRPPRPYGCARCSKGDHHAARRVGPYTICRCLDCPALVVEP